MSDLPRTVTEAAQWLDEGRVTSVQLTSALQARADRLDPMLGTFVQRVDEQALEAAARADRRRAAGEVGNSLLGVPIGVKDVFSTDGCPTTAQSLVLDPAWGDRGDGPAVARLRRAGAVIMGKTTTMEFAVGLPDPEKPFPIPRNPWHLDHWSGGSSSGTANGVAAGVFYGGLGTDTGGSIRMPAALCGITGLKPTWGRVPTSGCVPLAWSLDHVGPMARSARDCALLLGAIAGRDSSDPSSSETAVPDYQAALTRDLAGVRIGIERNHTSRVASVDPAAAALLDEAVAVLEAAGASVTEVNVELWDALAAAHLIATFSEAFTIHRRDLQTRWSDYGAFTRMLLAFGAFYTATDYVQANRVLAAGRRDIETLLRDVDVIATLTFGAGAPRVEEVDLVSTLAMPAFTAVWNGLRIPTVSVPIGFTAAGLPVGMQLSGSAWDECTVLRIADAYQELTTWHLAAPPDWDSPANEH